MKTIYPLIKILILTSLFFIFLDILIGKYIYKKFIRINFKDIDTTYLIEDDVYDHKFKSNYNALVGQGDLRWKFCSDSNGFRTSCEKISADLKEYDIGFIGDSFTEPVGVNYEDSFLYIISQNLPNKEIANLAAQSYSPSIYYAKINYLLSQGYMFNEIIVFIDLSDIVDETVCYTLEKDIVMKRETYSTCFREEYKFKDNLKNFFKHKLRLSYELHNRVKLILTELGFLKYQGLDSNINNRRSDWTHKYNDAKYNNYTYEESVKILTLNMKKLSNLLKKNEIELSVAVYPWPGTLKYDIAQNKHLEIWKNFCTSNCKKLYNLMDPFFDLMRKDGFSNVFKNYYLTNDVHFNKEGHKVIAKNFLEIYYDR